MSRHLRAKSMMMVSVVFGIYSLLWATAPFDAINFPARLILDSADWPVDNLFSPLDKETQLLSAIGSGLLAAVAIFLGGIVVPAIREGNRSVIRTTIVAMVAWYIIDGVGSIASGAGSNVIFNSIYLALVLIPLVGAKKSDEAFRVGT
ncbi:hypothetical protein MNBD_GAMMA20-2242 [hydrothermal vent metagenome]|uniref:Uncharacterized protein n=1 Tax=hydrothermal vent metagenome TaxID=652676 RepID=A0A3B1AHJ2_9ZZZZ